MRFAPLSVCRPLSWNSPNVFSAYPRAPFHSVIFDGCRTFVSCHTASKYDFRSGLCGSIFGRHDDPVRLRRAIQPPKRNRRENAPPAVRSQLALDRQFHNCARLAFQLQSLVLNAKATGVSRNRRNSIPSVFNRASFLDNVNHLDRVYQPLPEPPG
jgi:hypothetical protein